MKCARSAPPPGRSEPNREARVKELKRHITALFRRSTVNPGLLAEYLVEIEDRIAECDDGRELETEGIK